MAYSKRAQKAIEILRKGGYFRKALESVHVSKYIVREMFVTRLRDSEGRVVKGFGFKTALELESILRWRECAPSSTWPSEHILDPLWVQHNPVEV